MKSYNYLIYLNIFRLFFVLLRSQHNLKTVFKNTIFSVVTIIFFSFNLLLLPPGTVSAQVPDITPPVITLSGSSTITISAGDIYNDPGATAVDETDGDLTYALIVNSTVDTATPGTYDVTYTVADLAANLATLSRTVNVVDITAPVITITGSSTVTTSLDSTYTDDGATAVDETDGDLTSALITNSNVDTGTLGIYSVSYTVTDLAGNVATSSRTVIVLDTTAPVIAVIGSSSITISVGSIYTDAGATAIDETDGDLTSSITATSTVSTSTPGTYTVIYTVSDAAGNIASTSREVVVTTLPGGGGGDTIAPVITITGSSTITFSIDSSYTDAGATALDNVDGDITANIIATSTVNTAIAGTYTVTYTVTDLAGNTASSSREVIVEALPVVDITAPVITVTGSSTVTISVGSTYVDQGATALDNVDGDITANIISTSTVSTSTPGTYSVTYSVTDLAGNTASSSREVIVEALPVVDTTAPVITITGSSTVTINVGSTYVDQGATALDNVDGDLTSSITTTSNVSTSTPGTYSVTYAVTDLAGNVATSSRTVIVVDDTAPVITLTGSSTITISVGSTYVDQGATALDNVDGDITANIVSTSTVSTSTPGTYSVTYSVTDLAGNIASSSREVIVEALPVVDIIAPVITLIGSSTVTISVGSTYVDQGATALDETDGDLTSSITTTSTVSTSTPGTYTVTYTVTDLAGNVATSSRTVIVIDDTAPVITLTGSSTITISVGLTYVDQGATALDNVDGDLTSSITTTSTVSTSTPGTYSVTYAVTDLAGNVASSSRTVIVVDDTAPVITITGSSTVTISVGSIYTDAGATALDNVDGDITININASSTVSTSTPGTYTVTYTVTDLAGNIATSSRTVIVVDTTAPVITLNGSSTITISVGLTYTDVGATALDNVDGDLTSTITATSTVSTSTPGTYTVTYAVTDLAGNISTSSRTVIVVDDTAPVITITGSSTVTISVGSTYTDGGATALDNVDGNLTSALIASSTVSTSTPGTYSVTYSVTDLAGNISTSSRIVIVIDTTAPVITLTGSSTVTISVGSTYTDAGATALDNVDGDLTSALISTSSVSTSTPGTYLVSYTVTDLAGNVATSSRVVNVVDDTAPVITLTGSSTVTISVGSIYVDQGATALDETDGDLTSSITTTSTVSTSTPGTYTVTYTVSDTAGNVASTTRQVTVTALPGGGGGGDITAPVITITGSSTVTISVGVTYTDAGATALDIVDGDITANIIATSTVNTAIAGTYTVTYTVTDGAGNTASSSREVIVETLPVVDITTPVITINGSSTVTISVGSTYFDQGATALDNVDGDLTSSITTTSTVSTSTPGTYSVTYTVTDLAGNVASSSRTVSVVDITAPIITVTGSSTVTISVGSTYTDAGATALDNVDGNLTSSITSTSTVSTSTPGTYTVTYTVSDAAGNISTSSRTVNVVDTTAPVITITGSSTITISVGSTYVDQGATALDNVDGDLTSALISASTVSTSTPGTYSVTYTVTDLAGNVATSSRTVIVADTTAPVITITGSSTITISVGSIYTDAGATALDNVDGDLTSSITTTSTVSTSTPGTYTVTYTVTDLAGNVASSSRTVIVADTTAPVITITGSSTITISVGSIYTDAGATALDNVDGDITANIIATSTVNTATAGTYTVTYTVTDLAGNISTSSRTVIVVDDTAPVITITGSSTVTISVGSTYVDQGATALDNVDGDLTSSITTTSTVSTSTPGTYLVTYNVTDIAGNVSSITRQVTVTALPGGGGGGGGGGGDITAPVITIIGSSSITISAGSVYTDAGATALDNVDGDITANIISTSTVNTAIAGTYTVTYSVSDSTGNAASTTRQVTVTSSASSTPGVNPTTTNNGGVRRNNSSRKNPATSPLLKIASSTLLATSSKVLDKIPAPVLASIPDITTQTIAPVAIDMSKITNVEAQTISKTQKVVEGEVKEKVKEAENISESSELSPSSDSTLGLTTEEEKPSFWQKTYSFFRKVISYVVNIGS